MSTFRKEELTGIAPVVIDRYLYLLGWIYDSTFPNKKVRKYVHPKEPDLQIWVPVRQSFSDYYRRISDIIGLLSEWYEKDASEILKELNSTYSDHLEFRIISRSAETGKLPLYYASQCVKGIRNLIYYSACAEQSNATSGNAESLLRNFELGQTGIGSFIINVDAKVGDDENDLMGLLIPPNPPKEHRAVVRIAKAMEQVQKVVDGSQIKEVAADKTGLTEPMCRSLLQLQADEGGPLDIELETTIRYASAVTEQVGIKKVNKFEATHFEVVREIQQIYKEDSDGESITILGFPHGLQMLSKRNLQEYKDKISWVSINPVDSTPQVRVMLTREQHMLCCDALKTAMQIRVSGVLDKSKSTWVIGDVLKFELVSS